MNRELVRAFRRLVAAEEKLARLSNAKVFGRRHISPDQIDALQADYDRAAEAYHNLRREAKS